MLRCPHCKSGLLALSNDGYEDYYTCMMCAREWNKDLNHRRKTGCKVLWDMLMKDLTNKTHSDKMEIE